MLPLSKGCQERCALYERVFHSFWEWFTLNLFFLPWFFPFYDQNIRENFSSSLFSHFVENSIHSCCSLKQSNKRDSLFTKSETRVIPLVILYKKIGKSDSLICTKKWVICMKNQTANLQPCITVYNVHTSVISSCET